MTSDVHTGPLTPAQPTAELHAGPLAPATKVAKEKKSWREQRWERRRRRLWFEEALAWVLVPTIVVGCYYVVNATLDALGTSPAAIMDGLSMITALL